MKPTRLELNPQFPILVARAGLSLRAFARRAGLGFSTIMGLMHPELHPGRRGGMQLRTAWLLANAYSEIVRIDPDAAFALLIIERRADVSTEEPSPRPR
ncbi:hypothetical protein EKD04_020815 [Chloroflexales bacterium ZM16-3]|nr:hypothetical protein [Chloroflexales bacterium ZM16-3]